MTGLAHLILVNIYISPYHSQAFQPSLSPFLNYQRLHLQREVLPRRKKCHESCFRLLILYRPSGRPL